VQIEWSLFSRDAEAGIVPLCAELGVGFVAYCPLGRGFLTGRITSNDGLDATDSRNHIPRFLGDDAKHNDGLLAPVRRIAAAHDATPGQVALAWLHQQGERHDLTVVPIPGTTNPDRLVENAKSVALRLTEAELTELEPIAAAVQGAGRPPMPSTVKR
jgi:aryl-alcohol dehydrogenase-like predicted oxidoreductase